VTLSAFSFSVRQTIEIKTEKMGKILFFYILEKRILLWEKLIDALIKKIFDNDSIYIFYIESFLK
jgi:hypothetical protein